MSPRPDSILNLGDVIYPMLRPGALGIARILRTEVRRVHGHEVAVHVYSAGPSGVPPPRIEIAELNARNKRNQWDRVTNYSPMWELWREGYNSSGQRFHQ
jgi:hypothetical protein